MMKLLHVDASPKGPISNSRALSRHFVARLEAALPGLEVDYLDLDAAPLPHVSGDFARATYTPEEERTEAMKAVLAPSDALCRRVLAADAMVFAMPMYNWSMPSAFKAFVDAIVRTNLTYVFAPDCSTVGQLGGRKVLFLTTRGADLGPGSPYAAMDALTPSLRAAFGFLGVEDPDFVNAQPMQFADPEARAAGLARAHEELDALAHGWAQALTEPA